MAARYLGHEMLIVGPGLRTGMPIRMDNPREVGADRLVNAIAAYERLGRGCVVVDFGTAITYDVVSEAGEYLGGIITPAPRSRSTRSTDAPPSCPRSSSSSPAP